MNDIMQAIEMMANVADIYLIHGNIKYAFADLL